ncbi:MAG: hypothetical protein AVO39_10270 [delta proteobacterium MLS_D]|jgi:uncharacterized protein YdaU (DUF1376 family)|nr:MAG: hypothetical protein AVO39_10270 [delta proteobacterium MLS_D]
MADSYYRFFPGDYQRDTGDLTLVEHGAYRVLLDHYYMQGSLPANPDRLYRICRAFSDEERTAVATVVKRYFQPDGNRLHNRKADQEISDRQVFIESQREKGRKSAKIRVERAKEEKTTANRGSTGVQPGDQPEGNLPSPSPSPSPLPTKEKREGGTTPRFAPPSPTEVENYCQESEYYIDVQQFIDFYASKGWMIGKNKMKDWKAAVRNWHKRDKERQSSRASPQPATYRQAQDLERRKLVKLLQEADDGDIENDTARGAPAVARISGPAAGRR